MMTTVAIRKLGLVAAMLAMTGAAFAGPAVNQLGSVVGVDAVDASVQVPPAPEIQAPADVDDDTKGRCSDHHNNLPGCPGYCAKHQWHRSCDLPFHCRNNMQLHACKMHCVKYPQSKGCRPQDKSADPAAELFDPEAAAAEADDYLNESEDDKRVNCRKHHMRPGCPMFCKMQPLHKSCKHTPAYCHTNPNGYGCKKSAEKDAAGAADEDAEAKGRCSDHHNNLPGCPGYCNKHQEHRSCALPFHCRNNMQLHACRMHCVSYPNAIGCKTNKSADESEEMIDGLFDPAALQAACSGGTDSEACVKAMDAMGMDALSEDETKSICSKHHMRPGCPMYCQMNPMSKACGHKPAYCGTNPSGYGCK